ncbi:MAG: HEAT repeat domain-containing protein [Peptococcaceae bacterium]|nr:hypothetical protein [Peptococcaceae bacterium]MDH7525546.1 HEAT repeat domain-containing protein [Peptococcaceae bacterium]
MSYLSKENNKKKVYSLSMPPTQQDPFLHPFRHSRIIKHFDRKGNACHALNSGGEVDFYLLLSDDDDIEEMPSAHEEFALNISQRYKIELELYYDNIIKGIFCFDLNNPMDTHNLRCVLEKKSINIYYIYRFEREFVCSGIKTVYLPGMLCYDLQRHMDGQKPLLLPSFSNDQADDSFINKEVLLRKAWGFYMDFTAFLKRAGNLEEAEEIVTRHILHALHRIQHSRRPNIKNDVVVLWLGRRVKVNKNNVPSEFYSIYLSGELFTGNRDRDYACKIMEDVLKEIPEFIMPYWVSPLAEESIPLVVLRNGFLSRIHLSRRFYALANELFEEHFLPHPGYESYYHKVLHSKETNERETKVYNFLEIRQEKRGFSVEPLSSEEILQLVKRGREEDLPRVFQNLSRVKAEDMDEILVSLCEKHKEKIEPFLLPYLSSDQHALKAVAILGLGMIESVRAIPALIASLKGPRREASLAKYALALIGEEALPHLKKLLNDRKAEIRIRGIETLALLGSAQAFDAIKGMKSDRSTKVEQVRKRALKKFKGQFA